MRVYAALGLVLFLGVLAMAQEAPPVVIPEPPLPPVAEETKSTPAKAAQETGRPGNVSSHAGSMALDDVPANATSLLFTENGAPRSSITSNNSALAAGDLTNGFKLWHSVNGPMVFATNGTERMRILGDGKVGINTQGPQGHAGTRFSVLERDANGVPFAGVLWLTANYPGVTARATMSNTYSAGGYTGTIIGSNAAAWGQGSGTVTQAIGAEINAGVCCGGTGSVTTAIGALIGIHGSAGSVPNGYGVYIGDLQSTNSYAIFQFGADDRNYFAGNLGIGTIAPLAKIHAVTTDLSMPRGVMVDQFSSDLGGALFVGRKARGTATAPLAVANGDNVAIFTPQPYDGTKFLYPARLVFSVDGNVSTDNVPMAIRFTTGTNGEIERMRITSDGTVGIGTATPDPVYKLDVAGNIKATGEVVIGLAGETTRKLTVNGEIMATRVIGAVYQDLAEWVPATTDMTPGTVVVLNPERSNEVMPSGRSYDTAVAGVVSAQPGIILGEGGPSKEQIATTGRVKVRVDATSSPIRIGDLLVTSNKPGVAMKSIPLDLQGVAIHRPGTVLGKALEPLEGGEGEILVLLSLQ